MIIYDLKSLQSMQPPFEVARQNLCVKTMLTRDTLVKPELKPLPANLKYAYLGDNEALPVIISNSLTELQEEKFIRVLRDNKSAIGWTLVDIKGLSPTLCTHKIALEPDAIPKRDPQCRLNPPMMEVVQKEILKWLEAGVIYPIADSKWISPIHVVPKKGGTTIVTNKEGELIPT